ncbi:MAG: hypothetical protein K6B14_06465 [Lachnospiraceae bacterium]|nr:hypothetical protein [Lachnospiraceae bacterium]
MLGTNGLPQLRIAFDDRDINFSYLPVRDEATDRFILLIRSVVKVVDEDDAGNMLPCESFNLGSPFGFAVYDPVSGAGELSLETVKIFLKTELMGFATRTEKKIYENMVKRTEKDIPEPEAEDVAEYKEALYGLTEFFDHESSVSIQDEGNLNHVCIMLWTV